MSRQRLVDTVGPWTEIKQEIIRKYAGAYSRILATQRRFEHVYIDAFSGPGLQVSKASGEVTAGSPLIALGVEPRFSRYYFVDLDGDRAEQLRRLVGARRDVRVLQGDCNEVLLRDVFPHVRWEDYRRGLCLLDPKGLHLRWELIAEAARLGSIDLFLNFPVMDMKRNVFWKNREGVAPGDVARMTAFWGDETWREIVYPEEPGLFGPTRGRASIGKVAQAFRVRLKRVAGFACVPAPVPMENSKGVSLYYLFFASQKRTAERIATDIFRKYRRR